MLIPTEDGCLTSLALTYNVTVKNLSVRVGVQCISAYIKASDGNVDLYQVLEIIIE